MGSRERRDREKSELRGKILDAARELFVEQGYDAVTMRKVAERIEYSPTAIYLHFADKEALLREIVGTDFAALAAQFQKLARIEDPMERLIRVGRAYVEFGLAHPNHYRLMFGARPGPPMEPLPKPTTGDPQEDAYAFLRMVVIDAMEKKCLRPELRDPDLVAQVLWSGVHGIVSLQIEHTHAAHSSMRKAKDITALTLEVLMRGLAR
jgi:AcrR family transcriptional regulator